jgi:hypothetical protein
VISLNADETALVLSTLELPESLRNRLAMGGRGRAITGDETDLLVELATDRLMTHGFAAAYRPTPEGTALERLIDRLVAEDREDNDDSSRPDGPVHGDH